MTLKKVISWILLSVVVLTGMACSRNKNSLPPPPSRPNVLKGGTDITFFVIGDTHYGANNMVKNNALQIDLLNNLAGQSYFDGTTLPEPFGILVCGDLTEDGRPEEWVQFQADYGLTGKEGKLRFPIFEIHGNHDQHEGRTVEQNIQKRHGSTVYRFSRGDVQFLALGKYPDAKVRHWLKEHLRQIGTKATIVLFMHFNLTGPYSTSWSTIEKKAFAETIRGYNIVGIFHGHHHPAYHYQWEGVDVFNTGSVKHHCYGVMAVRITDDTMQVGIRNWSPWHRKGNWGKTFTKPLKSGQTATSKPH